MQDFSGASTQQGGFGELIPAGTLAWAIVAMRPHNLDLGIVTTPSKSSDAGYLDVELTIEGGQYDRRKVWDMIGVRGKEKYIQSGHAAIRHILEVGRGASPQNPNAYIIGANTPPDSDMGYMELDGLKVAVKVTIEKGNDGHPDKNRVRYLSPNPESDTCKDFARLVAGDTAPAAAHAPKAAAPAASPAAAWGATTASAPVATPKAAVAAQAAAPPAGTSKPSWLK